jgi:glutamine phosphoribosylpyrophosphate amidotransferase
MCGVVGAIIIKPTEADLKQVVDVMLNMQIRGQHATGVSWVSNDRVNTIKESLPANKFWSQFDPEFMRNEDGNLYMIGHVRYSTSDLRYHQPIADDNLAIVHNGVITQEPPEDWKQLFGYDCQTSNDSELIYQCQTLNGQLHPLETFPDSSMAVCEITKDKDLFAYRNHARPLATWSEKTYTQKVIFASTADALERSGFKGAKMTLPYTEYAMKVAYQTDRPMKCDYVMVRTDSYKQIHKDLQEV